MSSHNLLEVFGSTAIERVEAAIEALKKGRGILVVDNEDRENEGDLIYAAETVTDAQMAFMIRECSGIVCVCIEEDQAKRMNLPMMVQNNTSAYGTAFTISVDAAEGVTTGVSAPDRVKAIKAVINPNGKPSDLAAPGHMFPLVAKKGGVLTRDGHTEASVDLARLAGLAPAGILCELCAPDGLMAKLPRVTQFALMNDLTCLSIEDLIAYRKEKNV
ncbi:MAG: 3,4-dihydroxy-2-butanone-4-phosphate synthase [Succinivibrio sp.]|nr:3,4-dihydroxy-2-butanone-4-phosphate synthase [Succinivibrio sp.]MBR1613819.1 3,4-dihydroxy-2-butanone-4-phosphate synthase [Succinivibrio sp.]